jgi:hypothetical protein
MAAFLLLSADTDLTLGDIESWAARARALGATATSPVDFGDPPLPADGGSPLTLSVPVVVTRTILPGDAPDRRTESRYEPEARQASDPGADLAARDAARDRSDRQRDSSLDRSEPDQAPRDQAPRDQAPRDQAPRDQAPRDQPSPDEDGPRNTAESESAAL